MLLHLQFFCCCFIFRILIKCDTCNEGKQIPQKILRLRLICEQDACTGEGVEIEWKLDKKKRRDCNLPDCDPTNPLISDNKLYDSQKALNNSNSANNTAPRNTKPRAKPIETCESNSTCSNIVLNYTQCVRDITEDNSKTDSLYNWTPSNSSNATPNTTGSKSNYSSPRPGFQALQSNEQKWITQPHKELNKNEAPFGKSKLIFIVAPDILYAGMQYRIRATIYKTNSFNEKNKVGWAELDFSGGKKLKKGACRLHTHQGDELETEFIIKCRGWDTKVKHSCTLPPLPLTPFPFKHW